MQWHLVIPIRGILCFQLLFVYLVPLQGILEIHITSQKRKENGITKFVKRGAVPQAV